MVRAGRCCRRSRTFVRDQRIARAMARSVRRADTRRCRARRIYRSAARDRARRRAARRPDRGLHFLRTVARIRRAGTWCARCSIQTIWPSATGVSCFPAAAPREWPRPGRLSAPVSASGLKPSAARSQTDRPQPSPISAERCAPAPIAAPAFRNCRELSSAQRPGDYRHNPLIPAKAGIQKAIVACSVAGSPPSAFALCASARPGPRP